MNKFHAALAACCVFFFAAKLHGQTAGATPPPLLSDQSPTALITFPGGSSLAIRSHGGQFPLVIGYAAQTFTVQCRIPAAILSNLIMAPLDGGSISQPVLNPDGTTTLQYQFGGQPGLYRILVGFPPFFATLRFWVPGSGDNPPVLTP
jgi:hypothetical protein